MDETRQLKISLAQKEMECNDLWAMDQESREKIAALETLLSSIYAMATSLESASSYVEFAADVQALTEPYAKES